MDVEIKPLSGCMVVTLGILTLGLFPVFNWFNTRSWPKLLDEQGLVTRKGTRIPWDQVTKFRKVVTSMRGATTEHYEMFSPQGKVVVVDYRLVNGGEVLDYIWEHISEEAKQQQ